MVHPIRRPTFWRPGFFITVEGVDGAGKTTMVSHISNYLEQWGFPPVMARDPGGPPASEAMRDILKDSDMNLDVDAQGLLFFAAREQLIKDVIVPSLYEGEIVLSDRFVDSSFAMQYWAGGMDEELFINLASRVYETASPDLTIYLDISVEESRKRQGVRGTDTAKDAYESRDDEYHQAIRDAYLSLTPHHGANSVVTIDASGDEETVRKAVLEVIYRKIIKPRLGNVLDKSWWYHNVCYHFSNGKVSQ